MRTWKDGEIVAVQFDDDLEWGYVKSYSRLLDQYRIQFGDRLEFVESARITRPYPAPSQVLMNGFTLDPWHAKIDEVLMARTK